MLSQNSSKFVLIRAEKVRVAVRVGSEVPRDVLPNRPHRTRIKGADSRWFSFVSSASAYVLVFAHRVQELEQTMDGRERSSSRTAMDGELMPSITKFEDGHENEELGASMGPTKSTDCKDVAVGGSDGDGKRDRASPVVKERKVIGNIRFGKQDSRAPRKEPSEMVALTPSI